MAGEPSDSELLRRVAAGDHDAFTRLMRRHEDRIFGLAQRLTGNRADALEATQETFVSVFRAAATFRGTSQVSTWIYRIGINAAHDAVRRRQRAPVPAETPEVSERPGAGPEDAAITRVDLARALAQLPEDYRKAVVMYDLGGVAYEEIARLEGVPLGTVKSRISRGRRLLAAALEQDATAPASKDRS